MAFPHISWGGLRGLWEMWEKAIFRGVFADFLSEFVEDAKTFLVAKQQPQAGPKTPSRMVKKLEHFFKKSIFRSFSCDDIPGFNYGKSAFFGKIIKLKKMPDFFSKFHRWF